MASTNFKFLLAFIFIDYVSGVCVAIKEKELNSSISMDGILKKMGMILGTVSSYLLDMLSITGLPDFYPVVSIFIIINEAISILENLDRLGVPLPQGLVSVLKEKNSKKEK